MALKMELFVQLSQWMNYIHISAVHRTTVMEIKVSANAVAICPVCLISSWDVISMSEIILL